ncbi:undecaprenyldiphospho-muramoylpentapeptide beta-N-acetylglucosaminyltransferase [Ichthyobacterium seriolicida]|uniref:UDP-N-acetylglucosamine--N-acetylmuramyl-(pentapeptide) pyrophosphoryl-undecaprenol N-acetylglucosamine transferase n=1 Tax=Ichthyobacterium seriolicida TaxID=242600 RepID=A0A1J1E2S3_9FLAO|nr:undecaprenyldiphospho-muramoylpentapeptide beta-N-acetylglucosaminyltransferase [Ichthyobacterium seriolicida]BAV95253.1 UDP-N-acetylglucosamine--N-acetylmuramyl-(pentapeptide) pyrophosphoryl-undecaprenol N-acetylglucosamine transferase [Ichthyobacterium seriolicida]
MSNKSIRLLLSGGGTGGHIYPAVSIANQLKSISPESDILFVGSYGKMEMKKIPLEGYEIKGLWISGLQRKDFYKNLLLPIKLMVSVFRSFFILRSFGPDVVVGTGGYASGPILFAAYLLGIPTLIQEQNSYPGITNKFLGKIVSSICVAYRNLDLFFPKEKIIITGNPIRSEIINTNVDKSKAFDYFGLDKNLKTVLILGGSLGARAINEIIRDNLNWFSKENIQLIWQTGKSYFENYKEYEGKSVKVYKFLSRMDLAYSCSDIVISRAGAITLSELIGVKKASIIIPSPNVAEDHQTKNAEALCRDKAAVMIKEKDLQKSFITELDDLISDSEKIEQIENNLSNIAIPNSAKRIVDEILKLSKK